jgi:predicted house-cleaning noncanonical NTP pyrophosphatase (MazG superfamily)
MAHMRVKTYNKLVRDFIPQIIESKGSTCTFRALELQEYALMLEKKLHEEIDEYAENPSIEELADILEVILALAEYNGFSKEELEQTRRIKAQSRGGFKERILLEQVTEQ